MKILLYLIAISVVPLAAKDFPFYVGTYTGPTAGEGIYEGSLDGTGKLGHIRLVAKASSPSFLAFSSDGRFLYAALEDWKNGQVASFRRAADESLAPLNLKPAGAGTCFVSVDPAGPTLLAANYNAGSIAAFSLTADGKIGESAGFVTFNGSGPNTERQQSPHAHSIYPTPDATGVYACDLGTDRIWIFKLGSGTGFKPGVPPFVSAPAGSGTRHLAFSPSGKFVYASNEMGHSVTVFARDTLTNALTAMETVSVLPPEISAKGVGTAEIVMHPSGKWLYVSSRGSDTLSVFSINDQGHLALIQCVPASVKGPRSFALDPDGEWLLVAGQTDNRVAELRIDAKTGRLSPTTESFQLKSPACVVFAPDLTHR